MNSIAFLSGIGSILASLGGGVILVFAFSSWLGKVWANRLMEADKSRFARELKDVESKMFQVSEDRRRKLEGLMRHYERQIEEFYGPLFNVVQQIYIANDIQTAILKKVKGEASELVREYFNKTYFDPLHDEIRRTFHSKLYLVEGRDVPDSFLGYMRHAAQDRDQRQLWKDFKLDTSFLKGTSWPSDFEDDIGAGFKIAMRNYEECLEGLKK